MAPAVARVVSGTTGLGGPRPDVATVVQAAGGVVWRVRHGHLQVQLIHRPRYKDWSWPKGKVDPGETLVTTAVREVAEETGKPVVLGVPLPGLQYLMPDDQVKRVHYWAARRADATAPSVLARLPVAPVNRAEIDDKRWLPVEEALTRLTRKADRAPLEALSAEYEAGRLATRALVIARHGRAVSRSAWQGHEQDRPLTPAGHGQAHALVPVFAAFGVEQVLTSQWQRCADTVDPYVRSARIIPAVDPALTEASHDSKPSRVTQAVQELLAAPVSSLLCTHRPVLPTVLKVLGSHARESVLSALPSRNPYLQPGDALIAHIADTAKGPLVVGVERIRPKVV